MAKLSADFNIKIEDFGSLKTKYKILNCEKTSENIYYIKTLADISVDSIELHDWERVDEVNQVNAIIIMTYKFTLPNKGSLGGSYSLDSAEDIDFISITIPNNYRVDDIKRYLEDYFEHELTRSSNCSPTLFINLGEFD
jgi:hypothetical protein